MDRGLTEFNTVLHKKWIQEKKQLHNQKVKLMGKRIDNATPNACKHPMIKTKTAQLAEGKFNLSIVTVFQNGALRLNEKTEFYFRK